MQNEAKSNSHAASLFRRKSGAGGTPGSDGSGSLKQRSVRGGVVVLVSQVLKFVLQTGSVIVMARLLTPVDFGLQGMVVALTGILSLFRDAGLGAATIQREEISHDQVSTLFWINVALGSFLMLLSAALAPAVVAFYDEPRLYSLTIVSASAFFVNSLGVQHQALLNREMRFVTLAKIEITALVISSAIGVAMALYGFGYWSFVGVAVSGPAISAIGAWISMPWVPGLPKRGCGVSSMLKFGGTVSLNSVVMYFAYNSEKILLGKYWGAASLGVYGRAYQLLSLPSQQLHASMSTVAFPALSQLQNNPEHFCRAFLKTYSALLCVTIPLTLMSALFADELVFVLLGQKWSEAAPILRCLTPTILIFAMINPYGTFLYACGRVVRSVHMAFLLAPTIVLAVWLGIPYGPKGVAIGYSTALIVLHLPMTLWAFHGTGVTMKSYWKAIRSPLWAAVIALVCGLVLGATLEEALTPTLRLFLGFGVVLCIYVLALLSMKEQRAICLDLLDQVFRRKKTP